MHDLTGFKRDCLRAIAILDKPNGLEIKEELEEYYGGCINHARLYPNLDELADMGLIHKGEKDARTNEYWLTQRGGREVLFQVSQWNRAADAVQEDNEE